MFNLALPHHQSPVKIHSTASSVKSVKPVELSQLTVNALPKFQTAHRVHQDHQDQLVNLGNQEAPDSPDKTEPQANLQLHALHKINLAPHVQLVHRARQVKTVSQAPQDQMVNQEHPELVEEMVPQGQLDHREMQDPTGSQEVLDNQEAQDKTELAQPLHQDQRDQTAVLDLQGPQAPTETTASQAAQDSQVQRVHQEIQDNQEAMANQDNLDPRVYPDQMQHTAHAHQELPFSCTVNRLEQFSELHHTTAIILLLFVEKMKKDFVFKKV